LPEIIVELRDVLKQFVSPEGNLINAVDHVSLQIKDGEFFSLLGPSGCGKTTTLRLIAGFEQPTSGQVFIQGEPMAGVPPYLRPVNTVFQSYALFPHMTVFQNIAFGLEMRGVPKDEVKKRVKEALELVQLQGMEKRKPKQLSGGQQQRVALARALVNRPAVLLLDEPLGALDLKLRKAMQLELKQLQLKVGITFIYVTHDQEEALSMSDRIAVVNQGKIQQVGEPAEIYEHPANRFVANFIGESNFLDGEIVEIKDDLATVKLDTGEVVRALAPMRESPGTRVTVSIRPERMHVLLEPPADKEQNVVKAKIHAIAYLGNANLLETFLPDGTKVLVRLQNVVSSGESGISTATTWEAIRKAFGRGERDVYLTWSPRSGQVLKE
jgi:spermidine/putrescine transport system ATP-binding protein